MLPAEKWDYELDTLFVTNQARLRQVAYKILGNWERSDDVVHDAYIKVTEMSVASNNIRCPLAYLIRIVRNMAIDCYRRVVFETELFGKSEEGLNVSYWAGTPESSAINRQHLTLVVQALAKLPERTKHVFELYIVYGYTHRMIASELNISISLTNNLIHEAMNHGREIFKSCNSRK